MSHFKTIDVAGLKKRMDAGEDFTLVETMSPEEFDKGHLPGAINIPADTIEFDAPTKLERDECIVVYCESPACPASPQAVKKLMNLGYYDVLDFEAGKEGWKEAGLRLIA